MRTLFMTDRFLTQYYYRTIFESRYLTGKGQREKFIFIHWLN